MVYFQHYFRFFLICLFCAFFFFMQEKLEKATEKLKEDHIFYDRFINRMHRWLIDIAPKAMELFKKIDMDGEGAVTTDEFKSGECMLYSESL